MSSDDQFRNTFLAQLVSINIRSNKFPNALAKMLAPQEGVDAAMSLQGDDALSLVDVLDQAFDAPDMEIDLRRKSIRILRKVCGAQTILPRSCILSENITKEGDCALASGEFANVWRGRHGGNLVCIKAFRAYTADNLSRIKQRLFQEIIIWRRLSHPNVLAVSGVSPKLFPLCVITEWMVDGNIMDFTSKHPEVNHLRLLAEAASGLRYLHSMDIVHGDLKPTNILIDRDLHPRLTDYGFVAILLDPNTVDTVREEPIRFPRRPVRYMAPELSNPSGFGLKNSNPTKKSDIYAFGVVTYQVVTKQQPFPGVNDGVIAYNVVIGERPACPPGPNEWLSDDVWKFISRCWSPSWDDRPDVEFAMNALNDAADAVEVKRRRLYVLTNDPGRRSHRVSSPPTHDLPGRQVGDTPIEQVLEHSPPTPKAPKSPSPFVTKVPADSRATKRERRRARLRQFRVWHDSTGSHRQEAALVDYNAGVVHLSSPDGTLLEVQEGKLSPDDLTYVRSLDVYKNWKRKELQRETQVSTSGPAPQPPPTSTTSVTSLEHWEADLIALLRVGTVEVQIGPRKKNAQEFADRLDAALDNGDFLEQERRRCMSYLRKLCRTFDILPSSFILTPTFDERGTTPFATGGFSEVYEASLDGRCVAIKVLDVNAETINGVRRLLVKEVVGWKWLRHDNILPFVGVSLEPPLFSIISERMENGNITNFIKVHPNYNRLRLLAGAVAGLKYLHEHGVVHGDLKGANVLVDSKYCARLADFGLAMITDEPAGRTTNSGGEMRGTTRWMAPELMNPEEFGFAGDLLKQLPSTSTDVYAIGMTILEVLTGCHPFSDITKNITVVWKVMKGDRPDRPPSGFSDALWELLVWTWVVEDGPESKRRPSPSFILDQLEKSVDQWEKSIVPLVPKRWQEDVTRSGEAGGRVGVDAPNLSETIRVIPLSRPLREGQDKTIRRAPIAPGFTNKLKDFLRFS